MQDTPVPKNPSSKKVSGQQHRHLPLHNHPLLGIFQALMLCLCYEGVISMRAARFLWSRLQTMYHFEYPGAIEAACFPVVTNQGGQTKYSRDVYHSRGGSDRAESNRYNLALNIDSVF